MNIALIGAPSSGKSVLATQLADRLRERGGTVAVVDNYTASVEERTQMALGPLGDYLANLYVALERYALERQARATADHVISCGTLIETAVYVAMHFVALSQSRGEEATAALAPQMDAVLRMMAVLYNDIFTYDRALYLPPSAGDEDTRFMDQQLQAGLEGFKLVSVTPLLDRESQLATALGVLDEVLAA